MKGPTSRKTLQNDMTLRIQRSGLVVAIVSALIAFAALIFGHVKPDQETVPNNAVQQETSGEQSPAISHVGGDINISNNPR